MDPIAGPKAAGCWAISKLRMVELPVATIPCSSGKPARLDAQKRSSLHKLMAVLDANWLLGNSIAIRSQRRESPGPVV